MSLDKKMGAPLNNTNAIGNSGGKTINDRILAAEVRQLALKKIRVILKGKDTEFQRQIILRLASSVLPRLKEPFDMTSEPLQVVFDAAFDKSASKKETVENKSSNYDL